MKIILPLFAALLASASMAPLARAADGTALHALLIMASSNKAPADPRLAAYEAELQRNLPESSFRLAGEGSTTVSGNNAAKISLGQGQVVSFEDERREADGIHLKVSWMNGKKPGINGMFVLQPGVPLVLGRRPAGDGEVPIVLVIAK
jgi:hypothetical protein